MLISFCGYKSSGKDTCADYLVQKYSYTKVSFAKPLKDILKILFLFTDDQLYGHLKEVPDDHWYGCTPRTAMQYVGTQWIRNQLDVIMPGIGEDYFVNYLKLWLEQQRALNPQIKVVVSDLRNFENEIYTIQSLSGIIINIDRPDLDKKDCHESEQPISTYDELITNDGTLNELYDKIDQLMLKYN